jgi:hypothetical protein
MEYETPEGRKPQVETPERARACPSCRGRISPGMLHNCNGGSLDATGLAVIIREANQPLVDELKGLREELLNGLRELASNATNGAASGHNGKPKR